MYSCSYCCRQIANKGGLGAHEPYCQSNPDRIQRSKSPNAHRKAGTPAWNKGLTAETNESVRKLADKLRQGYESGRLTPNIVIHSEETKRKLSDYAKSRNFGGYTQGSGIGKKGWFSGFFCDSSWELAYVVYCLDHGLNIKRNSVKRQYVFEDKVCRYLPDFIVDGDVVELKGFDSARWKAKHLANPDVKVLFGDDLQEIFKYVKTMYGKNYIMLYERRVNPTGDGSDLESRRGRNALEGSTPSLSANILDL